jgi:hypothetical protein
MTEKKQEPELPPVITLSDFYAFMPEHKYIFAPNASLWPVASVNARLPKVLLLGPDGQALTDEDGNEKTLKPSTWLDQNRAVEAMVWAPGEPEAIHGRLPSLGVSGWIRRPDTCTFNTYRPPGPRRGSASGARRWRELLERLYPEDAWHITAYGAHCVQRPGVKINHAIVLAGAPRIGKDTLLEPLRFGVGEANFAEVSPYTIVKSEHNDYLCAVVLRVSEARDQGDTNRYALYEKMKTMLAAPPPAHRINTKYVKQYYAINVVCVFITTNYGSDGLYLPGDDGRHYVAATEVKREDFPEGFFDEYWAWQNAGGAEDVVAYLAEFDLRRFNPKAPPKKTDAFWAMVGAGAAPEVSELDDIIDRLGRLEQPPATLSDGKTPCGPAALTLVMLRAEANNGALNDLHTWLGDRKNRRAIPHRLASCGYLPVASEKNDRLWIIQGKRQIVYARRDIAPAKRVAAAAGLKQRLEKATQASTTVMTLKREDRR